MSVIQDHTLGKVWQHAGGKANGMSPVVRAYAWLTPSQRCRAERLRQARMLFDGRHREYFLDEGRSQYEFSPLREGEPVFFAPYNLLTNVAQKMADLLFGEACRIKANDAGLQKRIDEIADRSWLPARLNGAAVECCWAGETYLEITRSGGNAMIGHVPALEIYPLGVAGPDYQFQAYERYATTVIDDGTKKPRTLLLQTRYTAGRISREVYELQVGAGNEISRGQKLPIDQWPARQADNSPLAEEELTGLSKPSIIYVPNGYDATSDFDTLIDAQDALHSKNSQIGRVLAKHADPKLAAPNAASDNNGNLPARAEVYFYNSKDEIPSYIVWNAELDAADKDRDFARSAFCTISEMPPSLLGIKDDSAVESATKMRLNATPALAKAGRKATYWQAAIRMAMALAIEAETGSQPAVSIGVEMRDGLPRDEKELSETIANFRSAGVLSLPGALAMRWLDSAAAAAEQKAIEKEHESQMPSVLLGEPTSSNDAGTTNENTANVAV